MIIVASASVDGADDALKFAAIEGAGLDFVRLDLGLRADDAVDELLGAHLEREDADGKLFLKQMFSAMFIARAVFPMAGRAARIIRLELLKPLSILSRSLKWVRDAGDAGSLGPLCWKRSCLSWSSLRKGSVDFGFDA